MSSAQTAAYRCFLLRLRTAREEAKLTQVQVSKRLAKDLKRKLHQSFVAKCESGERRVDVTELQAFARIYKKPLSYFQDR